MKDVKEMEDKAVFEYPKPNVEENIFSLYSREDQDP